MESKKNIVKGATNTVRIIAGSLRHRTIKFIDHQGLRPTADRIRETTYNWIGHYWGFSFAEHTVLDLFAGSGAMGIEAISRGAHSLTSVESDVQTNRNLRKTLQQLGIENQTQLVHQTAQSFLHQNTQLYSLVLLDPPFASSALADCLPIIHRHQTTGGLLYVESPTAISCPIGYNSYRESKAGSVYFYLYIRSP